MPSMKSWLYSSAAIRYGPNLRGERPIMCKGAAGRFSRAILDVCLNLGLQGEFMRGIGGIFFSHSARAEMFAYRKRRKARITIRLGLDAQSKKRLNTALLDKQFISDVSNALEKQGRQTPFKVPVAIRMHFHVGVERTPPQIHQLPKHYLDLLQTPIESRRPNCRRLLLQDDRLVQALFCSYSFVDEILSQPFMTFEITTLTNFIRDLELHQRIATGDFDEIDGVRDLKIKSPYYSDDYEQELDDKSVDEYLRLVRMGQNGRKRYGEKLYDALLLMNKQSAQREILKMRELRPVDVATLYGPAPSRQRQHAMLRSVRDASAANVRLVGSLGVASADLGPPAVQSGDSDRLKATVRAALAEMRQQCPILDPLFVTIGVTLLYVPPLKGQTIDLDNLARRFVVPIVHEELKPPATSLHAFENLKPDEAEYAWVREGLERLQRAHKHQITRYQVFALPRIKNDPAEGKITVLIHGGDEIDRRWTDYRNELDRWESAVVLFRE